MKPKIVGIISILFTLAILILGGSFFKLSPRGYLGDKASMVYANENISKKDLTDFKALLEEMDIKISDKKINEIKEEIDNFYLVTYTPMFKSPKDYVAIIDLKKWYYNFIVDYEEYFDRIENYYILKEEWINLLKKNGIKYDNIYMIPHRGNFILSTNKKLLFWQIENSELYSEKKEIGLNKGKDSNLGVFIFNLNRDSIFNLKNVVLTLDYKDKKFENKMFFETSQKNDNLNVKETERELAKYIENNRLYIYNTDFYNLFITLSAALKLDGQYVFLINFLSLHSGMEISKLLEDIDREILYDISTHQGIVKLKNEENIKTLISSLDNNLAGINPTLKLENKKLYLGEPLEEKESENRVKLAPNQSFYFNYLLDNKNLKVQNYTNLDGIEIDIEMNNEMLKEMINKLKEERFNKDGRVE